MLSVATLQNVNVGIQGALSRLRRAVATLNEKIAQFEADGTRSQAYISENIAAERKTVLPQMTADLGAIRGAVETVTPHREFWADRSLLFSRIPFARDPAVDAQVRVRFANDLAVMNLPLLQATQKNALADGDLALAWACVVAAQKAGLGDKLIDLSGVDIPDQATALQLIDGCDVALAEGEIIVAAASGLSMDPVRKLEFGRRMQPNRPTQHNSPNRTVAN